jgi:virginiamycin B lyase
MKLKSRTNASTLAALASSAAAVVILSLATQPALFGQSNADKAAVASASQLAGLGSISGSVHAPKDFKAAKVFAHNIDKDVTYMVFTDAGRYSAVALFPGNYEVTVAKNGFSSEDVEKVKVTPGGAATADLTLQEGAYRPIQQARPATLRSEPLFAYDDLYPPAPGRQIVERTCMRCHGPDFLPNHQWDADQWNAAIDLMQSTALNSNPPGRISPSSVPEGISPQERQTLVDYLVKNFGPESTRRGLAIPEAPVDEKALSKAEFIEYHVPPLANGHDRRFHDEHLSANGDVWYTDANGLQIGKMDPRTASWTDYPLPDAKYRGHGLVQDAGGDIWVSGHTAFVRVDSKTGAMKLYPYHPNGERPDHGNTPIIDSRQNIWTTLMWTNEIAKWDRQTGEVSRFTVPTGYSAPYGMVIDKKDNLWIAEWFACKIARFDTGDRTFTEFTPPTKPCNIRRVFVDHAGMVWYALDSRGKIGVLDPATGKMTEYDEPVPFGFPYDIQEDSENNLWIADSGQGGGLYKFEPRLRKFTYFPAVQRTDMPKISISKADAIWYTTRGGDAKTMSLGALYPDKSKLKTLAAYPQ